MDLKWIPRVTRTSVDSSVDQIESQETQGDFLASLGKFDFLLKKSAG